MIQVCFLVSLPLTVGSSCDEFNEEGCVGKMPHPRVSVPETNVKDDLDVDDSMGWTMTKDSQLPETVVKADAGATGYKYFKMATKDSQLPETVVKADMGVSDIGYNMMATKDSQLPETVVKADTGVADIKYYEMATKDSQLPE